MPGAVVLTLVLAQSLGAEAADTAKLERIRRELAEPAAILGSSPLAREGLVFRVTIVGSRHDKPIWADLSGVPAYVRPMAPTYHYEFLLKVTPEEFRAGTLYPVGIPIVPLVTFLGRQITTAQRKTAEKRAREEVRQALEELLACRANPERPGC